MYAACLYCLLCSDDYAVRDYAERALVRLVDGWPGIYGPRVAEWGGAATHPEVAFRVRRPLSVYTAYRVNSYVPQGIPVWPVADCFPVPGSFGLDVRCRHSGMAFYSPLPGDRPAPYWDGYRRATEEYARGLIRRGESPEAVDRLLRRWWLLERSACSDCGPEHQDEIDRWVYWSGGYPEGSPK